MPYRIDRAEPPADSLRRAACERLRDRDGNGSAEQAVAAAHTRLAGVCVGIDDWEVAADGRGSLLDGLGRAYARGRAAFAAAEGGPTGERLHEWRKRVKDLRYQQRLLRDAWPEVDDDDLLELVACRRAELQEESFRFGRRVYAESPKRYVRGMRAYLEPA